MPYFFIWGLRDFFIKFRFERFTTWLSNKKYFALKEHIALREPLVLKEQFAQKENFSLRKYYAKKEHWRHCVFSVFLVCCLYQQISKLCLRKFLIWVWVISYEIYVGEIHIMAFRKVIGKQNILH